MWKEDSGLIFPAFVDLRASYIASLLSWLYKETGNANMYVKQDQYMLDATGCLDADL